MRLYEQLNEWRSEAEAAKTDRNGLPNGTKGTRFLFMLNHVSLSDPQVVHSAFRIDICQRRQGIAGASYLRAWELFCVGTKCWLRKRTFQSADISVLRNSKGPEPQASGLLHLVFVVEVRMGIAAVRDGAPGHNAFGMPKANRAAYGTRFGKYVSIRELTALLPNRNLRL